MPAPVMIVEDEIFLALDIERVLEDAGYSVAAIAADRAEALAAAGEARIAFVDLNLRDGLTGPAIARELAERHGMKIVYVTANPSQIDPPAPGAVGVVSKPFRDETILMAAQIAERGVGELPPAPDFIPFPPGEAPAPAEAR